MRPSRCMVRLVGGQQVIGQRAEDAGIHQRIPSGFFRPAFVADRERPIVFQDPLAASCVVVTLDPADDQMIFTDRARHPSRSIPAAGSRR